MHIPVIAIAIGSLVFWAAKEVIVELKKRVGK